VTRLFFNVNDTP